MNGTGTSAKAVFGIEDIFDFFNAFFDLFGLFDVIVNWIRNLGNLLSGN